MGVSCINNAVNDLHPFCMINISWSALVITKYSNCFVKGPSNKLSTCRWVIQIHYGAYMISMNDFGCIHFAHIKRITVRVFTSHCEIYWLNRIECKTRTLVVEVYLLDWWFPSEIIKNYWTIYSSCTNYIWFRGIISYPKNWINIPF